MLSPGQVTEKEMKQLKLLFLLMAIASALVLDGATGEKLPSPIPSPTKSAEKKQQIGSAKSEDANTKGEPTQKTSPIQPPDGSKKSNESDDNKSNPSAPDWVVRFTGIIAIVTFLQFCALVVQICLMRRIVRVTERAWLSVNFDDPYSPVSTDHFLKFLTIWSVIPARVLRK